MVKVVWKARVFRPRRKKSEPTLVGSEIGERG